MRETGGLSSILPKLRRGADDLEAMDALKRVTYAVVNTQKPGTVTVVFKINPEGPERVSVATTVKTTIPVAKDTTQFYADENGNLSSRDPRQVELPGLRDEVTK